MNPEHRQITRAAAVISLGTLLSRIMGFVRDMTLARVFGAGAVADAFFVAFRIPSMLRELFAEGSMSAGFIPVFSEYLSQGRRDEARRLASATFTVLIVIVAGVAVAAIVAAPWIVRLIAPGFARELGRFNLTVNMVRIMFPYLIFISLAALTMGVLNSLRAFALPAFSPVMFNLAIVGSVLFLTPLFTEPIYAAALGVTLGGMLQFAIQLPGLRQERMGLRLLWAPADPGVRRIGRLVIPVMAGQSVTQVNLLVSTVLASLLPIGAQSYLFYGIRLMLFPLGIFGVALGTAVLPTLSQQAAREEWDEMKQTLAFGLCLIFFIIVPAMAGLIALRVPIIHLVYEHGQFGPAATAGTATALLYYAVGLPAFAGVRIMSAGFYSMKDTRTPVWIAAAAVAANVGLSLGLMRFLQHGGLALATSLAALLNFSLLVAGLNQRLAGIAWGEVLRSVRRTVLATVPVAAIGAGVAAAPIWNQHGLWLLKAAWIAAAVTGAVASYGAAHLWLRSDELRFLIEITRRRLRRSRPA